MVSRKPGSLSDNANRNEHDGAELVTLLQRYAKSVPAGERGIVAIAGAPASGKSTMAAKLMHSLNTESPGSCALLPMDGFHYDDEVLTTRGWQPRKGAPHTFDTGGFAAALRRVKANEEDGVAVPRFDRSLEIARAGAIIISRSVRIVITEGNYLLLEDDPWSGLRTYFDRTVLLVADMEILIARNRQRWVDIDMDEEAIISKLELNDLPNARLVYERSTEPDWIIRT
jgi:pantothenate kinase